jgi:hypothetical protein
LTKCPKHPYYVLTPLSVHPLKRSMFYYALCNDKTQGGMSRNFAFTLHSGAVFFCQNDITSTLFPGMWHNIPSYTWKYEYEYDMKNEYMKIHAVCCPISVIFLYSNLEPQTGAERVNFWLSWKYSYFPYTVHRLWSARHVYGAICLQIQKIFTPKLQPW